VVFDSVMFKGRKQRRMMPRGLDVMAALGNGEAVTLLKDDLDRFNYGSNLWAARQVVAQRPQSVRTSNLYEIWLSALADLHERPAGEFPQAMQTRAWAHKQLQTQLASWAELRHDTILYGKQSYTAFPTCEYPTGYVEPYPAFYGRLAGFAAEAQRRMKGADLLGAEDVRTRQLAYFAHLEKTMLQLQTLANKELAGRSFDSRERAWIKKTLDRRGGGSGPPRYDGWYPELIYGGEPAKWKPTVADVHTDPQSGKVLEVGVGDVNFVVMAVDNGGDTAIYVGPSYSYYEFTQPAGKRMTDLEWQSKIHSGKLPARPDWTGSFQAPALGRHPRP
jgi:hypothetical protein